ncbi:MAG: hypothetical protein ACTSU2_01610 [Promethearchaeota archaeon]
MADLEQDHADERKESKNNLEKKLEGRSNNQDRWPPGKKFFLILGIPSIIIVTLSFFIEFLGGVLFLSLYALVMYFGFVHRRIHKYPYARLSKFFFFMAVIAMVSFFGSFWNTKDPALMGHQFVVNLDKSKLIAPDNQVIASLENEFYRWLNEDKPSIGYGEWVIYYKNYSLIPFQEENLRYYWPSPPINFSNPNVVFSNLSFKEKLYCVNYFINRRIIEWTEDSETYGSSEYKGTVEEVLKNGYTSNWQNLSYDDCDGIAVVTVSLLQRMGFNAFIGSGKGHWFTVVEPRINDNFSYPLILNSWSGIHVWYYFNQYQMKLGQPLPDTIEDLWYNDDMDPELLDQVEYFQERPLLVVSLSYLVAILVVMIIAYPRGHSEDIMDRILQGRVNRAEKIKDKTILYSKKSPLSWVVRPIYVKMGNPFQKVYLEYWIDVIWSGTALLLGIFALFSLINSYLIFIYEALFVWLILFMLDINIVQKLGVALTKMRKIRRQ